MTGVLTLLPLYYTDNQYKYNFYFRTYVNWKPECYEADFEAVRDADESVERIWQVANISFAIYLTMLMLSTLLVFGFSYIPRIQLFRKVLKSRTWCIFTQIAGMGPAATWLVLFLIYLFHFRSLVQK